MLKTSPFSLRRMNPRFAVNTEAEIVRPDGKTVAAQISELSSRGCYVDTVAPVPLGSELAVRISQGENTCELPGRVIYVHSGYGTGLYGLGVVFGELAAEQRTAMNAWLDALAGKVNTPAS